MTTRNSRAIIADGRGGFRIDWVDVALPEDDEILVRVAAAGLCHTDWDSIRTWDGPFIVGHEGAGTIEAVGPAVKGLAPGDRVVLNWAIPCGSSSVGWRARCRRRAACPPPA
jgi:Zn-dependent alcohol dehydrogenase